MVGKLTFVHLSDIHFRFKKVGTRYDLDEEIRVELNNDLRLLIKKVGAANGVLVSGDVAFGGKADEYDFARNWLKNLTTLLGCSKFNVWCIPGNHDVDREAQRPYVQLPALHDHLRQAGPTLNDRMQSLLEDEANGSTLFKQFEHYTNFAKDYNCPTTRTAPEWRDTLPLTSVATLKLQGINSAIISSGTDGNEPRHQLVVGESQSMHHRHMNEIRLTMCHHPPSWLADNASFEAHLTSPGKVPLQLFGHEHRFQVEKTDHYLRLYAGAIQPARDEDGWLPRYNLLQIHFDDETGLLKVVVYPRCWGTSRRFEPDQDSCNGSDNFEWNTQIELSSTMRSSPVAAEVAQPMTQVHTMTSVTEIRRLGYSYFNLPFTEATEIAVELGLLKEEDKTADDIERRRRQFDRAQKSDKLGALWDRVSQVDSRLGSENPFLE